MPVIRSDRGKIWLDPEVVPVVDDDDIILPPRRHSHIPRMRPKPKRKGREEWQVSELRKLLNAVSPA